MINQESRIASIIKIITIALVAYLFWGGIQSARGLYADGAHFFYEIATNKSYVWFKSRNFEYFVSQSPMVLALKLGITNRNLLIRIHCLGMIGIPIVLWIIIFKESFKTPLFWVFVLAFSVTFLNTGFFPLAEYNLCFSMTALSFLFLLQDRPLSVLKSLIVILLAFVLIRSYEATAFLGGLLFTAAAQRLSFRWSDLNQREKYVLSLAALFYLLSCGLAIQSIIFHPAPYNVDSAKNTSTLIQNSQFLISAVSLLLFLTSAIVRTNIIKKTLMSLSGIIMLFFLFNKHLWAEPYRHYHVRAFAAIALFLFFAWTLFMWVNRREELESIQTNKSLTIYAFIYFISLYIPFVYHEINYAIWIRKAETKINSSTGLIPWEEFSKSDPIWYLTYNWWWANPTLSAILAYTPESGIIKPPAGYRGYQRWDLEKERPVLNTKFQKTGSVIPELTLKLLPKRE